MNGSNGKTLFPAHYTINLHSPEKMVYFRTVLYHRRPAVYHQTSSPREFYCPFHMMSLVLVHYILTSYYVVRSNLYIVLVGT